MFHTSWLKDGRDIRAGAFTREEKRMADSLETRIDRLCRLIGRTTDDMQREGEFILSIVSDACRDTGLYANELVEDICSDSYESDEYRKMSEGLTKLEFFAPEMTRQRYQAEINEIFRTAWMIKVIDTVKDNIYTFKKYGPQFVDIITLAYTSSFDSTVEEMAEELQMSTQNFYKKKRYATILFAYEFERFRNALIMSKEPAGWHGEQMTIEDYMKTESSRRDFGEKTENYQRII